MTVFDSRGGGKRGIEQIRERQEEVEHKRRDEEGKRDASHLIEASLPSSGWQPEI